jgi:hypothetical protein
MRETFHKGGNGRTNENNSNGNFNIQKMNTSLLKAPAIINLNLKLMLL